MITIVLISGKPSPSLSRGGVGWGPGEIYSVNIICRYDCDHSKKIKLIQQFLLFLVSIQIVFHIQEHIPGFDTFRITWYEYPASSSQRIKKTIP
jgi:hypothetical protein